MYIDMFTSFPQLQHQDTLGVFQDEIPQGTGSLDEGGGTRRDQADPTIRSVFGMGKSWENGENHGKMGNFMVLCALNRELTIENR